MLDKFLLQNKLLLLLIILFICLSMALFLPAMTTFYIFYPTLVILFIIYLKIKQVSLGKILLYALIISLGTVFTLGIPWILFFMLFINIFPTYVVVLITIIIMILLPIKEYSSVIKIFIFVFLSLLIGLNTNLLFTAKYLVGQDREVTEILNKKLELNDKELIEIKRNSINIPLKYNKFDFLSFGSNEGCMCGYWTRPAINKSTIIPYILGIKEIPFSSVVPSDKKIIIDYKEIQEEYNLNIKILEKNELLSSLSIKDSLPFQGKTSNKAKNLNNFDYRLEYLLRHNIWNAIFYYFGIGKVDNKEIISNFVDKNINIIKTDKDWIKSNIDSILIQNSDISLCTERNSDNYKYYSFNTWDSKEKNYSIKLSSNPNRFIFNDNNITYTTISYSKEFVWHHRIATYKTSEYFFVLKITDSPFHVLLWKFNHQGDFLQEVHVKLPKNTKVGGRNWHPISHIEVINNKMSFRINNIYEHKNKKNECSYSKIEIEI
jgi:hypothetical protein